MADDPETKPIDMTAILAAVLSKAGNDSNKAIETLLAENFSLRDKNRTLKTENAELKTKGIPEGAIVLEKEEDRKAWEAYQALGKPDDLKKVVEERDKLKETNAATEREATVRTAAEAHKLNPKVLTTLAKDLDIEIGEIETQKGDGTTEKVKVAYVKDKSGTKTRLDEYAKGNWNEFMPSLTAVEGGNNNTNGKPGNGLAYPIVGQGGGNGGGGSILDKHIAEQAKLADAGNALIPKQQATAS